MTTQMYKGYNAHAISKNVFGDDRLQGYVVIPEDNPLYGKSDILIVSRHKLSFTYIRNLPEGKVDWVILFTVAHENQWAVIIDCKRIIDQVDNIAAEINQGRIQ